MNRREMMAGLAAVVPSASALAGVTFKEKLSWRDAPVVRRVSDRPDMWRYEYRCAGWTTWDNEIIEDDEVRSRFRQAIDSKKVLRAVKDGWSDEPIFSHREDRPVMRGCLWGLKYLNIDATQFTPECGRRYEAIYIDAPAGSPWRELLSAAMEMSGIVVVGVDDEDYPERD